MSFYKSTKSKQINVTCPQKPLQNSNNTYKILPETRFLIIDSPPRCTHRMHFFMLVEKIKVSKSSFLTTLLKASQNITTKKYTTWLAAKVFSFQSHCYLYSSQKVHFLLVHNQLLQLSSRVFYVVKYAAVSIDKAPSDFCSSLFRPRCQLCHASGKFEFNLLAFFARFYHFFILAEWKKGKNIFFLFYLPVFIHIIKLLTLILLLSWWNMKVLIQITHNM